MLTNLLFCLAVALPGQADRVAEAVVGPLVRDDVVAVLRVDVSKLHPEALKGALGEEVSGNPEVQAALVQVGGIVDRLKAAGVIEVDALVDMASLPGMPLVVIPIAPGSDVEAAARVVKESSPIPMPKELSVVAGREAVLVGSPAALEAAQKPGSPVRADFQKARAAGDGAVVALQVIPSSTLRRALAESVATLPAELGGGPIETLTEGLEWAALRLDLEPRPKVSVVVQAKDEPAAKALEGVLKAAMATGKQVLAGQEEWKDAVKALDGLAPEVQGNQVVLESSPSQWTAVLATLAERNRDQAMRRQCTNNMKMIALCMHNYLSAKNTFPPAYRASKEGKPLLSWRVALLPYLDQKALYDEFHHDEPWDSPHNKALIARMPAVYRCAHSKAGEGMTTYLVPRGPNTMFPGAEGVAIRDVTDGTSNTIMVVDAGDAKAVPWTKPEDWEIGEQPDIHALLGHHAGGFVCAFADGSAHFIRETTVETVLKALLSRNGGEVVSSDAY